MRAEARLSSFRADLPFRVIRGAFRDAQRSTFRIVHFSVQRDHLHLLVEASSRKALSSGMRGLAIRIARRLNRILGRRGKVFGDRWHGHALRSPREVRNALAYVLFNGTKHGTVAFGLDPCASVYWAADVLAAPCYGGLASLSAARDPPVSRPQTWLLRMGWRQRGLLAMRDVPRRSR